MYGFRQSKLSRRFEEIKYRRKKVLAEEIREKIIETVSNTGGHLASNLGVVELTMAIHSVFNCPTDKIIWDVGHQTYVHKILTGRKDKLDTLRQLDGLAGFPKLVRVSMMLMIQDIAVLLFLLL